MGDHGRLYETVQSSLRLFAKIRDGRIDMMGNPVRVTRAVKTERTDFGDEKVTKASDLETYMLFRFNEFVTLFENCDVNFEDQPSLEATVKMADDIRAGDTVRIGGKVPVGISRFREWRVTWVGADTDAGEQHGKKAKMVPLRGSTF